VCKSESPSALVVLASSASQLSQEKTSEPLSPPVPQRFVNSQSIIHSSSLDKKDLWRVYEEQWVLQQEEPPTGFFRNPHTLCTLGEQWVLQQEEPPASWSRNPHTLCTLGEQLVLQQEERPASWSRNPYSLCRWEKSEFSRRENPPAGWSGKQQNVGHGTGSGTSGAEIGKLNQWNNSTTL
jgi:hypothetical protein